MLEDWIDTVCRELGLDREDVDRDLVLDLAKDVAHGVARPAAPLTTYLLGLAVGSGQPAGEAAVKITDLAAGWRPARDASTTEASASGTPAGDAPQSTSSSGTTSRGKPRRPRNSDR